MSWFVDKLSFIDQRSSVMEEAEDIARNVLLVHHSRPSSNISQLLDHVGESTDRSPPHHVLELDDRGSSPDGGLSFVLTFTNLTYSVKYPKKLSFFPSFFHRNCHTAGPVTTGERPKAFSWTRILLDSISDEAREGEILIVLGASGSCKSTLIDALANQIARESLKGSITLNRENLDGQLLKVISAYVMQDDLLFPMLTMEEMLMFLMEFRLPHTLSTTQKWARMEALIHQPSLWQAANTIIDDEGHHGVSGGRAAVYPSAWTSSTNPSSSSSMSPPPALTPLTPLGWLMSSNISPMVAASSSCPSTNPATASLAFSTI